MKKTYTRTMMHKDLAKAMVTLEIYEGDKYTAKCIEDLGEQSELVYKGIKDWTVVEGGAEAEAIENLYGICDEHHEYLIITLANGTKATFRNSHVAMFII